MTPSITESKKLLIINSPGRFKMQHNLIKALRRPAIKNNCFRGFPGGSVVKNLPANAGDMGSVPGPGRSHMPWSS